MAEGFNNQGPVHSVCGSSAPTRTTRRHYLTANSWTQEDAQPSLLDLLDRAFAARDNGERLAFVFFPPNNAGFLRLANPPPHHQQQNHHWRQDDATRSAGSLQEGSLQEGALDPNHHLADAPIMNLNNSTSNNEQNQLQNIPVQGIPFVNNHPHLIHDDVADNGTSLVDIIGASLELFDDDDSVEDNDHRG